MRAWLAAVALSVAIPAGVATAPPAAADPGSCSGVWVVVDYGSLGGVSTECATSFKSGTDALKSAGFSPTLESGMVLKITGKPAKPDIYKAYWSYWHAKPQADGSFDAWSYSSLGPGSYHPKKGDAEGWRYLEIDEGKKAPGAKPPVSKPEPTKEPTVKPTKEPTKEPTKKPTPKPTVTVTKKPTTKPTVTVTKKPTPKPTVTVTKTKTPTPTTHPTPTPTETSPTSAQPTETSPTPEETPTLTPEVTPTPEAGSPAGSPAGLITTVLVLAAAGAGGGVWWWRKGRHR